MASRSANTSADSAKNLNSTECGNATNESVWSDKKCIQIAHEKSFPQAVKNLVIQKNIITRFFNFYLGANVHKQKGVSVGDLVFSVISIIPLHPKTERFMWKDDHFSDEGSLFSLALEDKRYLQEMNERDTAEMKETDKRKEEENPKNKTDDRHNESFVENKKENHDIKTFNKNSEEEHIEENTNTMGEDLNPMGNDATIQPKHKVSLEEEKDKAKATRNFPKDSDIIWFTKKIASPNAKAEYKQYGPVENAAFTASVNKYLELWDSNEDARISLKYFFGFVALTLLRGTTKTFKHLVNAFSNVKFVLNLNYIPSFRYQFLKYSAPHKRCIKCCYRTFRKRDENLRVMFAKVVLCSFYIEAQARKAGPLNELFPPNIMKVTVLSHTAGYGLGLISMIETLAKRTMDIANVVKSTRCKKNESCWERITFFFQKYMTIAAKQHTHYWARVIDGNCFKDLSCIENYPLAVILAVFIDELSNGRDTGIWQSTWMTKGENMEEYKKIGLMLYEQYKKTL